MEYLIGYLMKIWLKNWWHGLWTHHKFFPNSLETTHFNWVASIYDEVLSLIFFFTSISLLCLNIFLNFHWRIVDSQCCVSFCCTAKWIRYPYIHSPQTCRWHHPDGRKWRRTEEPFDESERGEWKIWLKTQHSEN